MRKHLLGNSLRGISQIFVAAVVLVVIAAAMWPNPSQSSVRESSTTVASIVSSTSTGAQPPAPATPTSTTGQTTTSPTTTAKYTIIPVMTTVANTSLSTPLVLPSTTTNAPTTTTSTTMTSTTITTTSTTTSTTTTSSTIATDSTAPTVTGVTSSTFDGAKKAGVNIVVLVTFSETVIVTGTPTVTMETGVTHRTANYYSGSGTSTLTFHYKVQAGDTASRLDYASTSALATNSGSIRDSAGNSAVLTLPEPGSVNSISIGKEIIIDTTTPTLISTTPANNASTVALNDDIVLHFSESVSNRMINTFVTLRKSDDDSLVEQFSIAESTRITQSETDITINPTNDLLNATDYYLTIAAGFGDRALNFFPGFTDNTSLRFTTVPATALTSSIPADNATGLSTGTVITLNFSEPVYGQAGKFVHIRKTSDNTLFESISANGDGNGLYPNGTTNPALITGHGTSLIRVTPSHTPEFQNNTEYYVTVDSGAFLNASGAAFVGLTNTTDLSFTTIALTCLQKMEIGQTCERGDAGLGGGTVFYTSGTGDTQYMEVAPLTWNDNSQELAFRWCHTNLGVVTGTAIGTGKANTSAISATCTSGAAKAITNKNTSGGIGGKTDWFLPSKDELNQLCRFVRQQVENATVCDNTGIRRIGFVGASYWSSSQLQADKAWYQRLNDGVQYAIDGFKMTQIYFRPVRSFAQIPCASCTP